LGNLSPELCKGICDPVSIVENILEGFCDIEGEIEKGKLCLSALFNEWVAVLIDIDLFIHEWEGEWVAGS